MIGYISRSSIFSGINYRKLGWVLLVSMVFIGILWGFFKIKIWAYSMCNCPLSYIIITGKRYYTSNSDIHQMISELDTLGTFMTQDVNIIQKKIESLSWVHQVSVRKQWPDTLKIHVVEYVPLAYWNESQVISSTGVVFNIPDEICKYNDMHLMPVLYGPEYAKQDVLMHYYIFNEILKSNKFQINAVKMDERYSWNLVVQDNIHLKLGKKDIIDRLYCFIKIYPIFLKKMHEKNKYIDYIDLRYRSGFAVKWMPHSVVSRNL